MGKNIMIVDDDQLFHDLYTEMLEDTEYRLIHVYDGDEALLELEQEKPDLILLDMLMDLVTGETLFLYLKSMSEYKDIPVIIISSLPGYDYRYKRIKDIEPNFTFLDKLVTKEKLLGEIKTKIG
jgi:CheY-like chemotaxis protein